MKNFKIKSTKPAGDWFTKGKIYEVINGVLTDDYGDTYCRDSFEDIDEGMNSKFELVVETKKYPLGTKLKIINAGSGAMGCNDCEGIVTDEDATNGWVDSKPTNECDVFNIKIIGTTHSNPKYNIGRIWGVREDGEYKILDKTIDLSDKKEENGMFDVDNLQLFDVVKLKNGELYLYWEDKQKDKLLAGITTSNYRAIQCLHHNEIKAVFRVYTNHQLTKILNDGDVKSLQTVWEEKQEVELTLDEIAEKFGVKVENLKIKK